jgi:pimeloyl-ACP methyl ester carboxylesterase
MASERLLEAEIAGMRVAYRRVGQGPSLVLLHGALSDSRDWRPQLGELADQFTLIAWDAPGSGQSSDPPETFGMDDWADCLAGLLDQLQVDRAHVLGLSWGGVLALELYRRYPERARSLVLADTYAGWRGSLGEKACRQRVEAVLRQVDLSPSEVVEEWMPTLVAPGASVELREELTGIMSEYHPAAMRPMVRSMDSDYGDLLPKVAVPTLLLWGEADQRSPLSVAEELRDAIPSAELVVIPGAGHMSNLERPEHFNAEVRRFCASL